MRIQDDQHDHYITVVLENGVAAHDPVVVDQTQDTEQESQLSLDYHETSEFNLTFESDAESSKTESESELIYYDDDEDLMSKKIIVGHSDHTNGVHYPPQEGGAGLSNGTTLNGYANGELGRENLLRDISTAPRRVSLDQLNSSELDGVVVTNAVVTIG